MPPVTIPPRLQPGDRVAIVAPSGPLTDDRVAGAVALLGAWRLDVVIGVHARSRAHDGMLAGSDRERAADLQAAWTDPSVAAVLCGRGGYGAGRLLEHLDWTTLAGAAPKVLLGSSDITALHQAWSLRLGLATVFEPMPATELLGEGSPEPTSAAALHQMLFQAPSTLMATEGVLVKATSDLDPITAPLVGGTLSLLAASLGTGFSVPTAGSIAFLEDVGEVPYRIDRMLTQLRGAGWFAGVRGIVVGSMHECGDPAVLRSILLDRLGDLDVPVLSGLQVGHGPVQRCLLLGALATIDPVAGSLSVSGLGRRQPVT